ncbi:MAG: thioredoxin domain-containing protein [Acidobacteria bacterium]|nr:thioredoxin domain-containing protein [Acidobacteriota bacterium]
MHTNRLAGEHSPYLLQHAHNPVDWYPWGEEAFGRARAENKPIFLSIGYSTCHWCHVMERESFESEHIAAILNRDYISIKVDREERPDIDRIYMSFVQATTGGGGWPMSVWLTPELKPFYGGTYFPPENRWQRPGFATILEHIANAWANEREKILESGEDIVKQLSSMAAAKSADSRLDERGVDSCFLALRRSFDARLGGFGQAPKFPRPAQFHFLHRYFAHSNNDEAMEMSLFTLREMHKGGMYDQLGGGFHRYSVDAHWLVPHFEKMLYDQAQLVMSYLEAYQITQDRQYADIARETLDYVLRDMTDPGGAFYSAEDADSVIDPAEPEHKGEGAFYIFSAREIEETVRKPESDWFAYRYGVEPSGNVHEDPHGEFTGRNILHQAHSIEETAKQFGVDVATLRMALAGAAARLMAHRNKRVRPHLDDKILVAWNGLMISAFAKAAQVLGDRRYLESAERATAFIRSRMIAANGDLLRRHRAGETGIAGFLDDYAFFVQALLELYEANYDAELMKEASRLTLRMIDLFGDAAGGGFFSTAEGDASVLLRLKDDYDGAEPSGNSMAVSNLLRLAAITNKDELHGAAKATLESFAGRLNTLGITVPIMTAAFLYSLRKPQQIILAGDPASAESAAMLREIRKRFLPHTVTLFASAELAEWLPAVKGMAATEGVTTAYVCENFTCQLPVTTPDALAKLLE